MSALRARWIRLTALSVFLVGAGLASFILFRPGLKILRGKRNWIVIYESKYPGVVSGFAGDANLSGIKYGSITVETESGEDRVDIDRTGRFWGYVGELNVKSLRVEIDGAAEVYHPWFNGSGMYIWVLIRN